MPLPRLLRKPVASIALHRADRILKAIRFKGIPEAEPKAAVRLSVFSQDPEADIASRQGECRDAVERTARLLAIRAFLKSSVETRNGEIGLWPVLAAKQAKDDLVAALEKLPGVTAEPKPQAEDDYGFRRRPKNASPPALLDLRATLDMAKATKARFAAADGAVPSEIDVGVVDAEDAKRFRRMAAEARRAADALNDRLRAMNASNTVDISDEDFEMAGRAGRGMA